MQVVNVHHNLLSFPKVTNINKSLVFTASLFYAYINMYVLPKIYIIVNIKNCYTVCFLSLNISCILFNVSTYRLTSFFLASTRYFVSWIFINPLLIYLDYCIDFTIVNNPHPQKSVIYTFVWCECLQRIRYQNYDWQIKIDEYTNFSSNGYYQIVL